MQNINDQFDFPEKISHNKNFRLLIFGKFISDIGNTFYNFAIGWFILSVTRSATQMALYMVVPAVIFMILSPIGGALVDRFNKVKVIVVTDFIRGTTILVGGFLILQNYDWHINLIILYSASIILAINGALFGPAVSTLPRHIVREDQLQKSNSTMRSMDAFQGIIGLVFAGILYPIVGIFGIFLINGISFLLSGVSELFIRVHHIRREDKISIDSVLSDMKIGLKHVLENRLIRSIILISMMLNFFFTPLFANGLPYLFNQILETQPRNYAFVQVAFAIGGILSAIYIGTRKKELRVAVAPRISLVFVGMLAFMLTGLIYLVQQGSIRALVLVVPFLSSPIYLSTNAVFTLITIGIMFVMGACLSFTNIPISTVMMKSVDRDKLGRVFSIIGVTSMALTPIAMGIAGPIIDRFGLNILYLVCTIGLFIATLLMYRNKEFKRYDQKIIKEAEVLGNETRNEAQKEFSHFEPEILVEH